MTVSFDDVEKIMAQRHFLDSDGSGTDLLTPVSGTYQVKAYFLTSDSELLGNGYQAPSSILSSQSMEYRRFDTLTSVQKSAFELVMGLSSDASKYAYSVFFEDVVSNLNFEMTGVTASSADINIGQIEYYDRNANDAEDDAANFAGAYSLDRLNNPSYPANYGYDTNYSDKSHGDIWFNAKNSAWGSFAPGGDGLSTVIHEIGHSLGLA